MRDCIDHDDKCSSNSKAACLARPFTAVSFQSSTPLLCTHGTCFPREPRTLTGVMKHPKGTTLRTASKRLLGQTFHANLKPSFPSWSAKFMAHDCKACCHKHISLLDVADFCFLLLLLRPISHRLESRVVSRASQGADEGGGRQGVHTMSTYIWIAEQRNAGKLWSGGPKFRKPPA